jgi:hypothetical protein
MFCRQEMPWFIRKEIHYEVQLFFNLLHQGGNFIHNNMKQVTSIFLVLLTTCASTAFSQEAIPATTTAKIATQPTSGYYGRMTAGVLAGEFSTGSFHLTNGYRFRHFEVGMGLGFERYFIGSYAPVFLESRYNFGKGSTQPFVGISAGYLVSLNRIVNYYPQNRHNYTAGLNVGLTHYFTSHFGITTSIGYRFSLTPVNPYYTQPHYYGGGNAMPLDNRAMHRGEIRIGVVFR